MAADIDILERLRSLADCDARSGEPLGKCMREAADTITALRDENNKLRGIISESASAIGNGAFISPTCTIGFMAGLPNEIGLATGALRSRIEELERERDDMEEARDKAEEEGNKLNCMRAIAERERDEARTTAFEEAATLIDNYAIMQTSNGGTLVLRTEGDRNGLTYASAVRALGKERT